MFIKGGFPGHAVLVTDVVVNRATGERRFLLTQSYMPAQEIHVLINPAAADRSVWYGADFGETLVTPGMDVQPAAAQALEVLRRLTASSGVPDLAMRSAASGSVSTTVAMWCALACSSMMPSVITPT